MRKDKDIEKKKVEVFNSEKAKRLLNTSRAFNTLIRVLVCPIKINKKQKGYSKRGVFILVFGYGEAIRKNEDLVIIWNENINFDYLSCKIYEDTYNLEKVTKIIDMKEIITSYERKLSKNLSALPSKREIIPIDLEGLKEKIRDKKGLWHTSPREAINHKLKIKHKTHPLLERILELKVGYEIPIASWLLFSFDSYFLLLRDVFNDRFHIDSTIIPDPYSITRSFLRFIGLYPVRQGGKEKRMRPTAEDEIAIKDNLREKCKNSKPTAKQVREAFKEQLLPLPTSHQIKKFQK